MAKTAAWSCSFACIAHGLYLSTTGMRWGKSAAQQQACRVTTEDVACLQNIYYWRLGIKSEETSMTLATQVGFAGLPAKG